MPVDMNDEQIPTHLRWQGVNLGVFQGCYSRDVILGVTDALAALEQKGLRKEKETINEASSENTIKVSRESQDNPGAMEEHQQKDSPNTNEEPIIIITLCKSVSSQIIEYAEFH